MKQNSALLKDFSSMKVRSGADQIGPWRNPTKESNTQALSSFSAMIFCFLGTIFVTSMHSRYHWIFISLFFQAHWKLKHQRGC